jgi:hypothetical protein
MEKKLTTFEKLSAINVNAHTEKKSNLTYLSWAWAWSETKKACPDATYRIGDVDYDEVLGFMCHTTVTIEGETLEMWLPVMDGANKSMLKKSYTYKGNAWEGGRKVVVDKTVEAATTFDINKTIMRCLVKNLAMFGMGIYIYAGEDLPETPAETTPVSAPKRADVPATTTPATPVLEELKKDTENWKKVVKYVTDNKALGIEKIGKQLNRKYKMTPAVKKEIAKLITE